MLSKYQDFPFSRVLGQVREYWMIYRGLCFLADVWFGSFPTPSPSSVIKLSLFLCHLVWRAKSYNSEKAWSSINHSILSGASHTFLTANLMSCEDKRPWVLVRGIAFLEIYFCVVLHSWTAVFHTLGWSEYEDKNASSLARLGEERDGGGGEGRACGLHYRDLQCWKLNGRYTQENMF